MPSRPPEPAIVVTGLGVTSAAGRGTGGFATALLAGGNTFGTLARPGRTIPDGTAFLGAEIPDAMLAPPDGVPARALRTASLTARAAVVTLDEAWRDARLDELDPQRIGLVVGGSNTQQRELLLQRSRDPRFVRPTYGMQFMDTDVCGLLTELFAIRGFAYTLGGASASGLLAVLHAVRTVRSGQVDACVAVGALMDLSYWECQAFRAMGAMGSDRYADDPAAACRPFDAGRDGFIYGEACAVVVVEREGVRGGLTPYGRVLGSGVAVDGNRNPNPSLEGEVRVVETALREAGVSATEVDYVNPHATGSHIGDETELEALRKCGLAGARVNATKSITGHGLTAAGTLEVAATLLQMRAGRLHPTRNLDEPIDAGFDWVRGEAVAVSVDIAMSLSMGFGGTSSAICLGRC